MNPRRRYRNWRDTRHLPLRCRYRGCTGKTVGLSVWCRVHTDRILAGDSGVADWPKRRHW